MLERQRKGTDIAKEDGKYKGRNPIEETKLQQVQTSHQYGKSRS
jgi:DNA invertase Pin-like site-specific DNA recombinase